ncbi:MAG: hypothetical protein K1X64_02875 [Myxococcaceae bacterium]|nr:hypothetical protein [Myxococcaceae bacterium]
MRNVRSRRIIASLVFALLCGAPSLAADEGWQLVVEGPITVKNREKPGAPAIKEVWAEGEIAAPVRDIQEALMTPKRFKNFMPNLKDSYEVSKPAADGSTFVYTMLNLPVVSNRDYVVQVWLEESAADGGTTFRNRWSAVPDKLPERSNFVRVKVNDGSWQVKAIGDGSKSWVVYKFSFDPAGSIPGFVTSMGNKQAVTETFNAVQREAQRLAAERKKAEAAKPPASAPAQ